MVREKTKVAPAASTAFSRLALQATVPNGIILNVDQSKSVNNG
jgi:hypothetical protein